MSNANMTHQQTRIVTLYIIGIIRRRCLCHVRTQGTKCTRCTALTEAKDAFPDLYAKAADAAAMMGPKEDF